MRKLQKFDSKNKYKTVNNHRFHFALAYRANRFVRQLVSDENRYLSPNPDKVAKIKATNKR